MDKETMFSQQDGGEGSLYQGALGATSFESVLWTAPSGRVISVRVYRVVNAATDPALAQRLAAGTLNWVRLEEDDQLYPVRVPVIYHDPTKRIFALVLPEDFRCRELEERAALLLKLADAKDHGIPDYVLSFRVVYGYQALQDFLVGASHPAVETTPVRAVSSDILRQTAEPDTSVVGTAGLGGDYETTGRVLEVSEADLVEVEDLPPEPQSADTGAKAVLQAEAEAVLEEMEGMDGWPAAGRSPRAAGQDLLDAESRSGGADEDSDERSDSAGSGQDSEPTKVAQVSSWSRSGDETEDSGQPASGNDGGADLLDASQQEGGVDEAELKDDGGGRAQQTPREPELPEALEDWPESGQDRRIYVDEGEQTVVVLALRGTEDVVTAFLASDPEIYVQLHQLSSYPLVVLAAVPKDHPELAQYWSLDVLDDKHLDVLDKLAADFRVEVDIYDASFRRLVSVRAHYPLEENTKLVRKTAMEHLTSMGDQEPDLAAAMEEWQQPDYPKLGDREHAFTVRSFEKIETPSQAATALGIVEWWADAEHEPYLLLVKSFPAVWWRKIKNRVVKAALEYGLWPPKPLVDFALSEGLATSKKDLIRHCLDRFCRTASSGPDNDLDLAQENENWTRLLSEAETVGIVPNEEAEQMAAATRQRVESASGGVGGQGGKQDEDDDEALPLDDSDIVEEVSQSGESIEQDSADALGQSLRDQAYEEDSTVDEVGNQEDAGLVDSSDGSQDAMRDDSHSSEPVEPIDADALFGNTSSDGSSSDVGSSETEGGRDGTDNGSGQSAHHPVAAGGAGSLRDMSTDELLDLLSDKDRRLAASLVLCERRDPATVGPLFEAVGKMTRSEVLQVLPVLVSFGATAERPLIEFLSSNKSFLRQGAALALGILRSAPAMEALVDCLLTEPTGIWREVARVLGEMGKNTVMSLASRLRTASGEGRERIAWALAHVAVVSEDEDLLRDLARSADEVMAAVARKAADLVGEAREASQVYEEEARDDESVVISFTRAFMEVLRGDTDEISDEDILESEDFETDT